MSSKASEIISRHAERFHISGPDFSGLPEGPKNRTYSESTGGSIARPGANLEAVSTGSTRPGSVFRTGTPKSGGFGRKRSTRSEPCPACGGAGCSFSDDVSLLVCWRSDGRSVAGWRYVSPGSSGGSLYAREGSSDQSIRAKVEHLDRERLTGSAVWAARVDKYLADREAAAQRQRLAQDLGVDVWSLAALSVGWKPGAYEVGAWTYPLRTAAGEIVSVGLRVDRDDQRQRYDSDGGKTKSPAGLVFVPGRWLAASGPVLVVEGMSDAAAIDSIRLDVVGHPGNSPAGKLLDELEKLLRAVPADREIVRIAERDPGREDDQDSPGRKGARATAQALATRLGRRIGVALAPDGAKDSRAWVRERWIPGPVSPDRRDHLRETFVSGILGAVDWFEPEDRLGEQAAFESLVDPGPEIGLDEYRAEMRQAVSAWASDDRTRGRIAVLAAPAGAGKTRAVDELALPRYDRWTNAVPTHANCGERLSDLQSLPVIDVDVAAFPKLDESTCQSFTEEQAEDMRARGHRHAVSAGRAQSLGFGVRATACRGCPLAPWKLTGKIPTADPMLSQFSGEPASDSGPAEPFSEIRCDYWRAVSRAEAAAGRLATLERVRRTSRSAVDSKAGRGLLVLDEKGFETLAPVVAVDVHDLESLASGLEGAAARIEIELDAEAAGDRPDRRASRRGMSLVDGLFDSKKERDDRKRWAKAVRHSQERRVAEAQARAARAEDQIEHLWQLARLAGDLAARLRSKADAKSWGVEPIEIRKQAKNGSGEENGSALIVTGRVVRQSARLLADALERSLPVDAVIDATALELVRRIHSMKADMVAMHADPIDPEGSPGALADEPRVKLTALATWTTPLPDEADVLILDGTLDVDGFSKRIGTHVEQIGPTHRIKRSTLAIQLPADVSRGTAASTVGRMVEQALAALPECRRVGLILLQEHRRILFPVDRSGNDIRTDRSKKLIPEDVLRRIARDQDGRLLVTHYGSGRDRSSNEWISRCDGLVLIGTPRPQATAVVAELVRRLDVEALVAGSRWGRRDWEAVTIDGGRVRCAGRGYLDPRWAAAAAAVTRVSLMQALERARTVVPAGGDSEAPGGIPVLLVSGEGGLGLPVVEALPGAISRGARRVEEVVRRIVEGSGPVGAVAQVASGDSGNLGNPGGDPGGSPISLTTPTRDSPLLVETVRLIAGPTVRSREVVEELLREPLDGRLPSRATVFRWISEAEAAGMIVRSGSTRATVYGLPCPVGIPDGLEVEPLVVGLKTVSVAKPEQDPVPDWELDDSDFVFPRPPAPDPGPPPWSSTWRPTGLSETVDRRELLPTGPAAA